MSPKQAQSDLQISFGAGVTTLGFGVFFLPLQVLRSECGSRAEVQGPERWRWVHLCDQLFAFQIAPPETPDSKVRMVIITGPPEAQFKVLIFMVFSKLDTWN